MSDESILKIEHALAAIEERLRLIELEVKGLNSRPICPSPGACISLQARLAQIESTVTAIKTIQDQFVGGLVVSRILWMLISGVLAAVISFWMTHK